MSLFDVLRYQNTNLASETELETLPVDLIEQYWIIANSTRGKEGSAVSIKRKCRALAQWAYDPFIGSIALPAAEAFKRALEGYNS